MNTTYAGDDKPETLSNEPTKLAIAALEAAGKLLAQIDPMASQQCLNAIEGCDPPPFPAQLDPKPTQRLINALIVAEAVIHDKVEGGPIHEVVQRALRATGRRLVNIGYHRHWLTYDIWVVAINETGGWDIPDDYEWKKHLKRIESVFFFDRNTITHLCSFSGSYWLNYLETRPIMNPGTSEELTREAEDFCEGGAGTDDDYFDQKQIDKLIEKNERGTVYHYGNPGFDLDEAMDSAGQKMHSELYYNQRVSEKSVSWDDAGKKVLEAFSDDGFSGEQVANIIMDSVREGLQSNSVL